MTARIQKPGGDRKKTLFMSLYGGMRGFFCKRAGICPANLITKAKAMYYYTVSFHHAYNVSPSQKIGEFSGDAAATLPYP